MALDEIHTTDIHCQSEYLEGKLNYSKAASMTLSLVLFLIHLIFLSLVMGESHNSEKFLKT